MNGIATQSIEGEEKNMPDLPRYFDQSQGTPSLPKRTRNSRPETRNDPFIPD
jgi:hypothetical protein